MDLWEEYNAIVDGLIKDIKRGSTSCEYEEPRRIRVYSFHVVNARGIETIPEWCLEQLANRLCVDKVDQHYCYFNNGDPECDYLCLTLGQLVPKKLAQKRAEIAFAESLHNESQNEQ